MDKTLVEQMRNGDLNAFRILYVRFWQRLYDHAHQKTGDATVAAEVVQDVFVRLWERRSTVQIEQVEAYLFTAVRYTTISYLRRVLAARQRVATLPDNDTADGDTADTALVAADVQAAFERSLAELPDKTRTIFALSRLEGMTNRQIADSLNISEKTVEYHITQALKALRMGLKDYFPT